MRLFNYLASGDNGYENDFFTLGICQDPGSVSRLSLYNVSGSGILEYRTTSDYIFRFERKKFSSKENQHLDGSKASLMGHPEYFSWIPGSDISIQSEDENNNGNIIPAGTEKQALGANSYETGSYIILDDYYPTGIDFQINHQWVISDVKNRNIFFDPPHTELSTGIHQCIFQEQGPMFCSGIINKLQEDFGFDDIHKSGLLDQTSRETSLDIYSSSLGPSVFEINLRKNFQSFDLLDAGSVFLKKEILSLKTNREDSLTVLEEWNSIFDINENSNSDSIFRSGQNRDELFIEKITEYILDHWDNKLKKNLWEPYINNTDIDLSSRDPEVLKSHILYCYTFFGASDDIRELGYYAYKDYTKSYDATLIKWHCGLGGKSGYSNNFRKLVEAEVYLPIINETKKVSKLSTMPLRSSFTYDIETNKNTGFNQYLSPLSITMEEVEGGYITAFPGGPYFEGKEILLVFNAESVNFVNWEVKDVSGNNVPVNNDKIIMPETSITVKAITS